MQLIRVGRRTINLEYLIMDEEGDGTTGVPAGVTRVTLESGKEFDLTGADASLYRRHVDLFLQPDPAARPPNSGAVGTSIDPQTGRPFGPAPKPVPVSGPRKRKQGS